ncbi:hypothetical protein [Campylobacter concisus]|uniref:hypothetical protein n=1 Tax=Campylobacter concisus TaxID=199 RepID=UPI00122D2F12|nr:hypothetical protein [Campylobacter concisus]
MDFAQYLTKNYIDLSVIIFIYLVSLTVFVDAYDMRHTLRALLERLSHEISTKVYKFNFDNTVLHEI